MRIFPFILTALLIASPCRAEERWAVYYGSELPAGRFAEYDLVVLDGEYAAPLAVLNAQGKTVLGYISFGEGETYRSYYKDLKAKKIFLRKNPQWKGHIVIDVRKNEWKDYLINTLIPTVLARGFGGVMFDTVDSPLDIGARTEAEKQEMAQASIALLCEVRSMFPNIKIMINRGFDILPEAAPCIDMLMGESTRTDLQLESKKTPRLLSDEEYASYVDVMKRAQLANPALKIYTLDYWPQTDPEGIRKIYTTQRSNGFIPYVSTMDLQKVYSEPQP